MGHVHASQAMSGSPTAFAMSRTVANNPLFLTSEDDAPGDAPTMLESLAEADGIVGTRFFIDRTPGVPAVPAVDRVIGLPTRVGHGATTTTTASTPRPASSRGAPGRLAVSRTGHIDARGARTVCLGMVSIR
jgi:hypothetical protein